MLIIYTIAWILVMTIAGILYLSGHSNELTLNIFAFFVATLFWAGFIVVLPWWVDKIHAPKYRSYK